MGLPYVVGVTGRSTVWPPGRRAAAAQALQRQGPSRRLLPRRTRRAPAADGQGRWPSTARRRLAERHLARGHERHARARTSPRVRVRHARRRRRRSELRPRQWLLIEWPEGHDEPMKYWLSTLPEDTPLEAHGLRGQDALAHRARLPGSEAGPGPRALRRPRLARLSPPRQPEHRRLRLPDGRATQHPDKVGGKKNSANARSLPYPRITNLGAAQRAQRHVPSSITSLRQRLSYQLIERMGYCPCCGNASLQLRF